MSSLFPTMDAETKTNNDNDESISPSPLRTMTGSTIHTDAESGRTYKHKDGTSSWVNVHTDDARDDATGKQYVADANGTSSWLQSSDNDGQQQPVVCPQALPSKSPMDLITMAAKGDKDGVAQGLSEYDSDFDFTFVPLIHPSTGKVSSLQQFQEEALILIDAESVTFAHWEQNAAESAANDEKKGNVKQCFKMLVDAGMEWQDVPEWVSTFCEDDTSSPPRVAFRKQQNQLKQASACRAGENAADSATLTCGCCSTEDSNRKTGLVHDTTGKMALHCDPYDVDHPECPERLQSIMEAIRQAGLYDMCVCIEGRKVSRDELQTVHTKEHIDNVDRLLDKVHRREAMEDLESDSVYANEHTTEAAYLSCGASLAATEAVLNGTVQNALVIARPPGHHAEACQCMGFCIFNNVAVAAACAIEKWSAKKVLILDWDVHHGNGTQHMFENNPNIMYVSLHRYEHGTFYPGSKDGGPLKTGGDGTNLNIGWNTGRKTDEDYAYAFEHCVMPACREFAPDLVYVSAGFDAARGDPLGGCDVSPLGYGHMTKELSTLAEGKIIVVLEGGYNLQSIAASTLGCLNVLLGGNSPPYETRQRHTKEAEEEEDEEDIRLIQIAEELNLDLQNKKLIEEKEKLQKTPPGMKRRIRVPPKSLTGETKQDPESKTSSNTNTEDEGMDSDREDAVQSVKDTIRAHHALLEHHRNAPKWPIEEMKRLGLVYRNQARTTDGATPLYIASQQGHTDLVAILLGTSGIHINQPQKDESNALIIAALNGHVEVVRLLLQQPNIELNKKSYGKSPLGWATQMNHTEIIQLLTDAGVQ